ncbi:flagellar hook-length control protein FliK [Alsobacter soli]|uniref:flagellar hook-length control protein FliK n=1 Tax=Alsobacter soli TaxID=2109933 RepID=UPI0011B20D43|nr:flagellar hook-length control protein FliK [Alsobacter soli]
MTAPPPEAAPAQAQTAPDVPAAAAIVPAAPLVPGAPAAPAAQAESNGIDIEVSATRPRATGGAQGGGGAPVAANGAKGAPAGDPAQPDAAAQTAGADVSQATAGQPGAPAGKSSPEDAADAASPVAADRPEHPAAKLTQALQPPSPTAPDASAKAEPTPPAVAPEAQRLPPPAPPATAHRAAAAAETAGAKGEKSDAKAGASSPSDTFPASFVLDPAGAGPARPTADASSAAPASAAQDPRSAASTAPSVPLSAVPIEIGMRALGGAQSFQIRLHPEEYGRVDVKLDIDGDGAVTAQLVVDRVETLNLLQRDAKTLERAFEQAGLKTSDNGLQFSLNTNSGGQNAQQDQAGRDQPTRRLALREDASGAPAPVELAAALRGYRSSAGGLDIRI